MKREPGVHLQPYLSENPLPEASRAPPPTRLAMSGCTDNRPVLHFCRSSTYAVAGHTWMLSADGRDLGRHDSRASMSLVSEGVQGLLVLLALLEWPREGLQVVTKLAPHLVDHMLRYRSRGDMAACTAECSHVEQENTRLDGT